VHILHTHNVNIQTLNTQIIRAPLSGSPLFDLTLEAHVPIEKPIAQVKTELSDLAVEMNLDLNFKA
jgi:glycine cleavage system regulatory protein